MPKITFMGAGSTIFAKNILGDCLLTPSLQDAEIALYDIDAQRLEDSHLMLNTLNQNINQNRAKIDAYHGTENRKKALENADFVVNAIQVGGYEPATVIDFEIPKKFGLRQTIADTLGIGGIFRTLRTVPVVMDFAKDMEAVCPDAWFLNYVNPMAMITGAMQKHTPIKTVGLCHSVQVCAKQIMRSAGLLDTYPLDELKTSIAGINHMAWLLEISHQGKDLYPIIKEKVQKEILRLRKEGIQNALKRIWNLDKEIDDESKRQIEQEKSILNDLVRLEMMFKFGHYITESSEHNAEYLPYWIKSHYPELIDEFNIPLDEYPRRCIRQIEKWDTQKVDIVKNTELSHEKTHEYGSSIMESILTDKQIRIGGNVINHGLIPNLPSDACVEVPCLVDRNGLQGCYVGNLPPQLAALNQTNINVQQLCLEALATGKKEHVYHAALLDPHTSAELKMDDIVKMCDELFEAHQLVLSPIL